MLKSLACCAAIVGALALPSGLDAATDDIVMPTRIENVQVRDGVNIAVAVYLPNGGGRSPTLFAASPYRFDNNLLPPTPQFVWRETGPIKWYLDHGYAFVHMDVRGTGRSDGDYRFLDSKEQTDLYDVIEWIAQLSAPPDTKLASNASMSAAFADRDLRTVDHITAGRNVPIAWNPSETPSGRRFSRLDFAALRFGNSPG